MSAADELAKYLPHGIAHAHSIMRDLDAAGYVIVPKTPTENMLFVGSNEAAGFTAENLRECWRLMIEEAMK